MPKPRKELISLDATPYYHCTSRCVRRAFLCGTDSFSGKSYEHRRLWVEQRILLLASIFTIDVCAYAVMSNHHHVVLHINKIQSQQLSNKAVCQRWHRLYKGTLLTQRYARGEKLTKAEQASVNNKLQQWRNQLCDISWFMRALNEPIARLANAEDKCTGRFWESRFKSQALLDEKALLACMAYVDLNPIRAKLAATPEQSKHTSIKKRLSAMKQQQRPPKALAKFIGNPREPMPQGLPFQLKDYIELVDWTGRIIRSDKRGAISQQLPPILERLAIQPQQWLTLSTQFESRFKSLVGVKNKLKEIALAMGYQRTPGLANCAALF
ncbi:transposase [Dasania sp. GY-MA-18]|uniref:Transposase n=1 Tax=Dasania phycosphaerae TaxID=2950436 RepID=A0A9J6RS37_9GAMM|nr:MULTISPECIES: transposase [Dasania]MCR8924331.1 transposase [Dasania sp. GY-MA-18]MCZ0866984.1 transposase [Dasania phycosphaerae]MCZ0870488.1 transposase [Dasania phycosphaerae]